MKKKCDKCNRPATHHAIEIINGKKVETHLCDFHAAEEGMTASGHTPINELLTNFVKINSGVDDSKPPDLACETCGLTFSDFREKSLLGCADCYRSFEKPLSPMIERAQEGATHHVGKVPARAGASPHRQVQLTRMRKRLDDAVMNEDYELAAQLRDEIGQLEAPE
ncbi:MAG: UvrB/UvrC motif-containing protein [Planctomycetota bacterium]